MGIGVSRICPAPLESDSMEFSEGIVNTGSFGNVYVLKYTARPTMFPQTNNDEDDETRDDETNRMRLLPKAPRFCDVYHYSVLCDIKGASTTTLMQGRELHLVLDRDDPNSTVLDKRDLCEEAAGYEKVFFIGKYVALQPLMVGFMPVNTARFHLDGLAFQCYRQLCMRNNRSQQWSATCNCHQLAYDIINEMNLDWPADLSIVGNCCPLIIDSGLRLRASINKSSKK
jgi:hypothetical protein